MSILVIVLLAAVAALSSALTINSTNKMDMKWVSPCNVSRTNGSNPDTAYCQLEDHADLLNKTVIQARIALNHAELFRDDFIRQIFKTNEVACVLKLWRQHHYTWLPTRIEIPKELGEKLDNEHLNKLDINTSLVAAYEYMQKYAVGLEQVVWDQKDYHPRNQSYHQKFVEVECKLQAVLCMIQVAIEERCVTRRPDVTRDIMPPDFRNTTDMTSRGLRDWLIFRDYMNGLEYVIQVFSHLCLRL
ncbi:PREDICTED: uncharacterized protein LOC108782472 [Cyphomyrmex costatus]|uniref:uncharacterized protein LOC108782472 n=1 Tax=Cyphomyrmex costatus TaxID=456900 RepID=UPI0008522635|nr:PREDICTED: uncharacterized protein LOC108782472 [Cyphomyrmex costatus]